MFFNENIDLDLNDGGLDSFQDIDVSASVYKLHLELRENKWCLNYCGIQTQFYDKYNLIQLETFLNKPRKLY